MTVKETTVKRPRCRWSNITIDIDRMRCGGVTKLVSRTCEQGNGTWRSKKEKEFVFSWETLRFWRTLLCGDSKLVDWLVCWFIGQLENWKLVSGRSTLFFAWNYLKLNKLTVFNSIQGGSNMTGTDLCVNIWCQSRPYLNHLVYSHVICVRSILIF